MQTDREDVALEKALELSKAILFRKVIKLVLSKYETLLMYKFSNDFDFCSKDRRKRKPLI